ncbi:MazG nucleotide pyrophosphohydrolase domain-containing protein [Picosynechococcus sp. PCC 73109]|uniref:MazG nucleotide pyrophosphohydrolase domain-containing protein n=1 Tax=Picosynechococcus sp. PCC 73109 TaxID=374982 RepID=UPI0028F40285|nr:MazG nucleotide pyrophosphohydrolase domain-containing protein [Picosynechococcus sp. PCC 73109]
MEEVGETARLINYLHETKKKKPIEAEQNLPTELTDMMFAIICLANVHNIDLQTTFEDMMAKYNQRDGDRFFPNS